MNIAHNMFKWRNTTFSFSLDINKYANYVATDRKYSKELR